MRQADPAERTVRGTKLRNEEPAPENSLDKTYGSSYNQQYNDREDKSSAFLRTIRRVRT